MHPFRRTLVTLVLCLAGFDTLWAQPADLLGVPMSHSPGAPPRPLSLEARRYIQGELEDLGTQSYAGGAIGVKRAGRILFSNYIGCARLDPRLTIREVTGFEIAGLSKHVTAFCIALLVQEGRVRLDAPVKDYLPNIHGTELKVHHLLHHTGNVHDYLASFDGLLSHIGCTSSTERVAEHIAYWSSSTGHGQRFNYSDSGYVLLAQIVRAASGQTLRQFAHKRIFEPLGMARTDFNDDVFNHPLDYRACAYVQRSGHYYRNQADRCVVGDGGLVTTLPDFLRWEDVLAGRRSLGSGAPLTLPGGARVSLLEAVTTPGRFDAGEHSGQSTDYAFGFFTGTRDGRRWIAHGGRRAGWRCSFMRYPEEDLSVVILTNGTPSVDLATVCNRIVDFLRGDQATRTE